MESAVTGAEPHRPFAPRPLHHVATGLLVAMLVLYGFATLYAPIYPWLGFVRAFAEAAVVGALADWFAVVALFRHPLGLPIPHTAIIPRNKDRIGASLGRFVEENFLEPEILHAKLGDVDLMRYVADWLKQEGRSAAIAANAADLLPQILDAVEDEDVSRFVSEQVVARVGEIEVAPLAGEVLGLLTQDGRHQEIMDALLQTASQLLAGVRRHDPAEDQREYRLALSQIRSRCGGREDAPLRRGATTRGSEQRSRAPVADPLRRGGAGLRSTPEDFPRVSGTR